MQNYIDIQALNQQIQAESAFVDHLKAETAKVIVGQEYMIERLLIGLLTKGHILLEGMPGLAKTLAIKTLAQAVDARFSRIQFTPDLLPADVLGTMIYNPAKSEFTVRKGPIFANFVLADEINRAAQQSYRAGEISFADLAQYLAQAIGIRRNYLARLNEYNQAAVRVLYLNNQ